MAEIFEDAIVNNDVEKFASLFTEDSMIEDPFGTLKGPEGARLCMEWIYSHFEKIALKEILTIVRGNVVVIEYFLEGITRNGETVTFPGVLIEECEGLKIRHLRNYFDGLSIFRRLREAG